MSHPYRIDPPTNRHRSRTSSAVLWFFAACLAYALLRWLWGTMAFGAEARRNATLMAQAYADGAAMGGRAVCGPSSFAQGNCFVFVRASPVAELDCDDDPIPHNNGCELIRFRPEGITR